LAKKREPIFIVRFEDIIENKFEVLSQVMSFIFNQETIEGTNLERKIKNIEKDQTEGFYKPKERQKFKSLEKFNNEIKERMLKEYSEFLSFFRYDEIEEIQFKKVDFEFDFR